MKEDAVLNVSRKWEIQLRHFVWSLDAPKGVILIN